MAEAIISSKGAFELAEKCLKLTDTFYRAFECCGSISLSGKLQNIVRQRELSFAKKTMEIFKDHASFLIGNLSSEKDYNMRVVRESLRSLLEIYCRALFLNRNRSKVGAIKRIIGEDYYTIAFLENVRSGDMLIIDQYLAKNLKFKLPEIKNLRAWIKETVFEFKKQRKELCKFNEEFRFPSVKSILQENFDNNLQPVTTREFLYWVYSILSSQLHGNIYFGMSINGMSFKYQILSLVVVLYLHFLQVMAEIVSYQGKDKIDALILEWENKIKQNINDIWWVENELIRN